MTFPGGLTPTGFQAETTADVQASIERDELALMDPALNLSTTQPLGQLNGIFAGASSNKWALLQAIYAAIDPANAVGVQLDNLCALTGVTRLPATPTVVSCTCNFNAGQTYAAGQLVANIAGAPQYTFTNVAPVVNTPGGTQTVVFQATQTGPIAVNAATLTVITSAVGGWTSITNALSGTTGTNIETDTQLRLRRATLLVAAGGCTIDSIRSGLLNPTLVPGVLNASVLENNTDATDGLGNPPHSFQALIWDGTGLAANNTQIAQAIWNAKPSGIRSYGTSSAIATDASGNPQTVFFTRVTQLPIYFAMTVVTTGAAAFIAAGGVALIQAALGMVFAALQPGADVQIVNGVPVIKSRSTVYALQCEAAVLSVQGVLDIAPGTFSSTPPPFRRVWEPATSFRPLPSSRRWARSRLS